MSLLKIVTNIGCPTEDFAIRQSELMVDDNSTANNRIQALIFAWKAGTTIQCWYFTAYSQEGKSLSSGNEACIAANKRTRMSVQSSLCFLHDLQKIFFKCLPSNQCRKLYTKNSVQLVVVKSFCEVIRGKTKSFLDDMDNHNRVTVSMTFLLSSTGM